MKRQVLVTGCSGFLGKLIANHLRKYSEVWDVVEISGRKEFSTNLEIAFKNPIDTVIHCGFDVDFKPYNETTSDNIRNTQLLADWAIEKNVNHFVFLSGAAVLGVSHGPRDRDENDFGKTDPPFLLYYNSQYVRDKITCEKMLSNLAGKTSILYLTTVYGPKKHCDLRNSLIKLQGPNPFVICPPGGTSYLDYRDFLDALDRVLARGPTGPLVISSGNLTFAKLFSDSAKILGVKHRKLIIPIPRLALSFIRLAASTLLKGKILALGVVESAFGFKYYKIDRATKIIGYGSRFSLNDTLKEYLAPGSAQERPL